MLYLAFFCVYFDQLTGALHAVASRNHFLMLKQLFPLSYDIKCLKTQKNKRKNHIYPQESTSFWVSTNIKDNTYTLLDPLLLHVFVQLSSLFSLFCSVSDRKSCFSINKNWFQPAEHSFADWNTLHALLHVLE